jgi:hypothetical protein
MDDTPDGPAPRRRRATGGLWRLLPFATIALLIVGNYRHATEGRMPGIDGQDYVILALLVAAFLAFYGKPAPAEEMERVAYRAWGAIAAAILAAGAALLFSLPWFARFMPHSMADWRVAGMDLIVVWLLVDFFHAWLRPRRRDG